MLVSHQQGVFGVDDDQVLHAKRGDDSAGFSSGAGWLAHDHAVVGVFQNGLAAAGVVAVGVFAGNVPEAGPAAHVAPAGIQRNHGGVLGFFHDGVVDGVFGALFEGVCVYANKVEVGLGALHGLGAGPGDIGGLLLQFVQVVLGAEHEHAAVPEVVAAVEVLLGGLGVGFFDEGFDFVKIGVRVRTLTPGVFDVTVSGMWFGGDDTKGDEFAGIGDFAGLPDSLLEGGDVLDNVVGGEDQEVNGVTVIPAQAGI